MKKIAASALAFLFTILQSDRLIAHGDHGVGEGTSLFHYLLSPLHVFPIIGLALIGFYLFRIKKRSVQK